MGLGRLRERNGVLSNVQEGPLLVWKSVGGVGIVVGGIVCTVDEIRHGGLPSS